MENYTKFNLRQYKLNNNISEESLNFNATNTTTDITRNFKTQKLVESLLNTNFQGDETAENTILEKKERPQTAQIKKTRPFSALKKGKFSQKAGINSNRSFQQKYEQLQMEAEQFQVQKQNNTNNNINNSNNNSNWNLNNEDKKYVNVNNFVSDNNLLEELGINFQNKEEVCYALEKQQEEMEQQVIKQKKKQTNKQKEIIKSKLEMKGPNIKTYVRPIKFSVSRKKSLELNKKKEKFYSPQSVQRRTPFILDQDGNEANLKFEQFDYNEKEIKSDTFHIRKIKTKFGNKPQVNAIFKSPTRDKDYEKDLQYRMSRSPDTFYDVNYSVVDKNPKTPTLRNGRDFLPYNYGRGGHRDWPHIKKTGNNCEQEVYENFDNFYKNYMKKYKSIPNFQKMLGRNEQFDLNLIREKQEKKEKAEKKQEVKLFYDQFKRITKDFQQNLYETQEQKGEFNDTPEQMEEKIQNQLKVIQNAESPVQILLDVLPKSRKIMDDYMIDIQRQNQFGPYKMDKQLIKRLKDINKRQKQMFNMNQPFNGFQM